MVEREPVFIVNMLGSLSFYYDDKTFSIKCNQSSKVMQLFLMLLEAGEEGIPKAQLLEFLYGRDETQDIKNALRILVFRLRKLIGDSILPPDEYIQLEKGIYRFGGHLNICIDATEFERNVNAAICLEDENERQSELKKVCSRYRGEFLSSLSGEEWITAKRIHYKNKFDVCLKECIRLMKKKGQYNDIVTLCRHASEIYPFEEWQQVQIDCLLAMNRYQEAFEIYEKAVALFFEQSGLAPSEKILSRFRAMSGQIRYDRGDFSEITENLAEKKLKKEAYYCNYPSFIDSYQVIARMMERSGQSVFLMLCILTDSKGNPLDREDILREQSLNLSQSIGYSLRRGDLYTRYRPNQFLILLIGIKQEDCEITFNRIYSGFRKKCPSQRVQLRYYVSTIAAIRSKGKKISFQSSGNGWKRNSLKEKKQDGSM